MASGVPSRGLPSSEADSSGGEEWFLGDDLLLQRPRQSRQIPHSSGIYTYQIANRSRQY